MYVLSLLPLPVHHLFADILAWEMRVLFKYRVPTVRENLKRSFPEKSDAERHRIEVGFYRNFADIFCESVWTLTRPPRYLYRIGVARIDNEEVLDEAFKMHKGVVVLFGHCGNWELGGGLPEYSPKKPAYKLEQGTFVYKPLTNKTSEILFKYIRLATAPKARKNGVIPSSKIYRFITGHRDEDRIYFFISDQSPDRNYKHAALFLNQPTGWNVGGAKIAKEFGMPVVYLGIDRTGRSKYVLHFTLITPDASKTDENYIINKYISLLETDIRRNPSNWLWSHRRWKLSVRMPEANATQGAVQGASEATGIRAEETEGAVQGAGNESTGEGMPKK